MAYDGWIPLRTRNEYKKLEIDLNDTISDYYDSGCSIEKCDGVCLSAYRFMKYIRSEITLSYRHITNRDVEALTDAIMAYYTVAQNDTLQAEVESLEVLSRAAYLTIKSKVKEELSI